MRRYIEQKRNENAKNTTKTTMKYNKLFICRFECVINAKEKQIHMVKKHKFDVFINIKMEHNKKRNNNKK